MLHWAIQTLLCLRRLDDDILGSFCFACYKQSDIFYLFVFQAANPGCIFEDFVRWYSPNDWILGPETKQEKEDLAKMKFCLQKESEKGI